jgi:hypothetical protein
MSRSSPPNRVSATAPVGSVVPALRDDDIQRRASRSGRSSPAWRPITRIAAALPLPAELANAAIETRANGAVAAAASTFLVFAVHWIPPCSCAGGRLPAAPSARVHKGDHRGVSTRYGRVNERGPGGDVRATEQGVPTRG